MEILTQPTQLKMMMHIMMNRNYRFLFTVILGFCLFCSVAEASQIELVDFLKSKYLGKKIPLNHSMNLKKLKEIIND